MALNTDHPRVRLSVEMSAETYNAITKLLSESEIPLTVDGLLEHLEEQWKATLASAYPSDTVQGVQELGEVETELRIVRPHSESKDEQAYFWTPEWQAQEREVDEHLAAGRYEDFATMEDFLADLQSDDDE